MIFFLTMLFCSITLVVAFYYCFYVAGKEKKQILLGVTLPKEALESEEVKAIAKEYNKKLNQSMLILLLAGIPVHMAMNGYISIFLIVYTVWGVLLYFIPNEIMKKENRKLYKLKRQNEWIIGETKTIYVDTRASVMARKYPLSSLHFLLAGFICLLPLYASDNVGSFFKQDMAVVIFVTSLFTKVVFFLLYKGFFQRSNKVYSHDTKINQKCIGLRRNILGNCFVILSYLDSISFVIMEWGMEKESYTNGFAERIIIFCLLQMFEMVFLFYSIFLLEKRKKEILSTDKSPIIVDEDEYWKGMYYYNPNDKRIFVQDRVFDSNITFNMAHPVGKTTVYGLAAITIITMVWLSIEVLRMDFVPYGMEIKETTVSFTSGGYNLEVDIEDIKQVTLLENLPDKKLAKTNGGATDDYLLGKFRMEDMGNCYMYVYLDYPLLLQIDTTETTIFFNSKNTKETEQLYKSLSKRIAQ
ncbi:MAG: hypothetical protein IJN92_11770 [Lachnospiraceae bacterium]|nr:hypothetical protein [Lachnospiraceae bacterium]